MSNREYAVDNIIKVLRDMDHPKPTFVTREPFDVLKIAITQFPAILITTGNEIREDDAMGGIRRGIIQVQIRGYVRADGREGQTISVDQKRNELIERIEDFRYENRIPSRSEAIRILVEAGLKVKPKAAKKKK